MTLLEQFLHQEATPQLRKLLLEAISDLQDLHGPRVQEFTFNRFNVYLDAENGTAIVDDELDVSENSSLTLKLSDFAAALQGLSLL